MSEPVIQQLTEEFMKFPGIGPRQAKRFVYYLLKSGNGTTATLATLITNLRQSVLQCGACRRFFYQHPGRQSTLCNTCADLGRDSALLMLVEKDVDLETVERSGAFGGYYFVLGGLVPILDKNPATSIRQEALLKLIKTRVATNLREIILALAANPDGDHTTEYLQNLLAPLAAEHHFKITVLGRGLSTGTELEYSDSDTLKNAFKNRA